MISIPGINSLSLLAAEGHYDPAHHVQDATQLELPFGIHVPLDLIPGSFELTKFMILQLIAFGLTLWIFRGLARRAASGEPVKGRWWNFWEALALFVRDQVVRPTIGGHDDHGHGDDGHHHAASGGGHISHDSSEGVHVQPGGTLAMNVAHPADRYLPFVWSCFFYVLICNLLGAIPFLGSATGDISVTAALALVVFGFVMFYGSKELGFVGFWKNLCPSMELPLVLAIMLLPAIWLIELLGLFIKHGVLAVRLFANIMAGHTVLAVILGFIFNAAHSPEAWMWWVVTPASILGQVAIGLLELFVAFLQAYVFAFLATLFIGAAVHQH
ncbi:MAG TPA: F0F1 ATP synthase subunit A [Planctomycetaceae bacterium]|nr:F0F1 ATP synthase subunit A [Planctomycetaceae bacterium]